MDIPATAFDANRFVKDFERALETKELDPVFSKYYDNNVEYLDENGKTKRGVAGMRQMMDGWANGFSDTKVELTQTIQNGNEVAILQRCTARHTGDFEVTPGEKVPATNKSVELTIAEFIKLNDQGKIVRDIGLMDSAQLLKQLGLMPAGTQDAASRRAVQR